MIDRKLLELAAELDEIRLKIIEHYLNINNLSKKDSYEIEMKLVRDRDGVSIFYNKDAYGLLYGITPILFPDSYPLINIEDKLVRADDDSYYKDLRREYAKD